MKYLLSNFLKLNLFVSIILIAAHSFAINQKLNFEEISRNEGLSHTHVLSIFTDSEGFLWAGTYNGLNKYNGEKVSIYEYTNKTGEHINDVFYDITEDKNGILWFGAEGGLYFYDRNKDLLNKVESVIPDSLISRIIGIRKVKVLDDNKLLLATFGNGLFIYDHQTNIAENFLMYPDSISSYNRVNTVTIRSNKQILVGTENTGLKVFDTGNKTFKSFFTEAEPFGIQNINISSIAEDANGNLWIGTWGKGLFTYNEDQKKLSKIENKSIGNIVRDIKIDKQNNLWIASFDQGISYYMPFYDNAINHTYNEHDAYSIKQDMTWVIHIAPNEMLWIGTFGSGLNKVAINNKLNFLHYKNSKITNIYCLGISPDNNLIIGTIDKGVYIYNSDLDLVTKPKKLDIDIFKTVDDVVTDQYNRIWLSTSQGIYVLDKYYNLLYHFNGKHPIYNGEYPYMLNLYIDNYNRLWVSIRDGGAAILDLNSIKNNDFNNLKYDHLSKEYLLKLKISTDIINVYNDSDDNYWLTIGGQLYNYNYQTKKLSLAINSMCFNIIEDSSENLWMTNYIDLIRYSKSTQTYEVIGNKHNEQFDIFNLVQDDFNNIWATTNKGIIKYNLNDNNFSVYHEGHGFKGLSSNYNSSIKLANGNIALAGYEGLVIFNPKEFSKIESENPMYFSDFKIYGNKVKPNEEVNGYVVLDKAITLAKQVTIPPYIKVFSIEFGTINYNKPDKLRYAYKLEGFDDKWNMVGSLERKASYTNIKKGTYTLKIAEVIPYINWEQNYESIKVIVIPPIYERLWFKVIIPVIIVLILLLAVYIRIKRIKRSKKILENLVEQRTQELNISNSELKEKSEELVAQAESLAESNATKDKLFSIIAHDLKNPFTTIIGFLDLLDLTFDELSNDKKLLFIKRAKGSADQAYNLLENLLTWSRSQQGKIRYNPKIINLYSTINSILEISEPLAANKEINLKNLIDDKEFEFNADSDILRTVVRNLLTNSIKFTPEKGEISINFNVLNNEVVISIEDNGVGMSNEIISNLFNTQKNSTMHGTNNEKGTGLGLLICKDLIERHHGSISVESEVNEGSIFYIHLPCNKE